MGFDDAIDYLYGLQQHGIKLGLQNPLRLMALLGDPHRGFKSVHVAGTNGKGSTSAAIASILQAQGRRVGLFTSPHMLSFTERIRVDGVEITPDEVSEYAHRVREAAERDGLTPTFFEVVTAMGFLYFRDRAADWAVIETGLGGRLDATNVLAPNLTVITPLDYDHRQYLGESLREIAGEKAGIIKPGIPVVVAAQEDTALAVIEARASELAAPLHLEGREFRFLLKERLGPGRVRFDYISKDGMYLEGLEVPLSGGYQAQNMSVAARAVELIGPEGPDKDVGSDRSVREGLSRLRWPGRLEVAHTNPLVILDGAHNPAASRVLAKAMREEFMPEGDGSIALVFGAMADKDVEGMLRILLPLARDVHFASPDFGRAAGLPELRGLAYRLGREFRVRSFPSVSEALTQAMRLNMPVLVTGSFYVIGEAKEALGVKSFHKGLRE